MNRTLTPESLAEIDARLKRAHDDFARIYPGPTGARQPVHTVYAGAQLFHADTMRRLGANALHSLDEYAPNFAVFAKAIGLDGAGNLPDAPEAVTPLQDDVDSCPVDFRREDSG